MKDAKLQALLDAARKYAEAKDWEQRCGDANREAFEQFCAGTAERARWDEAESIYSDAHRACWATSRALRAAALAWAGKER